MKSVTEFYDKTATGWSEEFFKDKKENEILKKFISCFTEGGTSKPKILDLGCGAGYDAKFMSELGAKVVGVDISEKLIDIAKKNVTNCKFFVGDITNSMEKFGKFEGVVCLATIVHIDINKVRQTLNNMSQVLKKGGLLILSACDGNGKDATKSYIQIDGDSYDRDFNNYNASELCALAYPNLKLVDTWRFDDFSEGWRYYIFMKQ